MCDILKRGTWDGKNFHFLFYKSLCLGFVQFKNILNISSEAHDISVVSI